MTEPVSLEICPVRERGKKSRSPGQGQSLDMEEEPMKETNVSNQHSSCCDGLLPAAG